MPECVFLVQVQFLPRVDHNAMMRWIRTGGEDEFCADFAKSTRAVSEEIERRYRGRAANISVHTAPYQGLRRNLWVDRIDIEIADRSVCQEIMELPTGERTERAVGVRTPVDPASIHAARWVPAVIDGDCIDVAAGAFHSGVAYPVACNTCGSADMEQPPEELVAFFDSMRPRNQEIYCAENGVWVVRRRVLDCLEETVPGEFITGRVRVLKAPHDEEWFWIRPVGSTGYRWGQDVEMTCTACGRPLLIRWNRMRSGNVLSSFGSPAWNIARVGIRGFVGTSEDRVRPTYQEVVVSGGLFAALWHARVRGLFWPEEDKYADGVFISLLADEETLSDTPRMLGPTSRTRIGALERRPAKRR